MTTQHTQFTLLALIASLVAPALAGAVPQGNDQQTLSPQQQFDSPALAVISDEDTTLKEHIKRQINENFANFKSVNEVHAFLDKVKLLVQKHPKNVAFARDELKDLHKLLSTEIVTQLIRVDAEPFSMPISDDRMPVAQRAIEDDELTRKLFSGPLMSLMEAKRQHTSRTESGNHRDGNFFANFWCKISGSCPN